MDVLLNGVRFVKEEVRTHRKDFSYHRIQGRIQVFASRLLYLSGVTVVSAFSGLVGIQNITFGWLTETKAEREKSLVEVPHHY